MSLPTDYEKRSAREKNDLLWANINSDAYTDAQFPTRGHSMIAKLIVHGRTRGDAIKIMQRALKEFRIDGVKTTISLHQKILSDSYFRTGNIDTQFIKKRIATYEAQKENGKNYFA